MYPNNPGSDWRETVRRIAAWRPNWSTLAASLEKYRLDRLALQMRAAAIEAKSRELWSRLRARAAAAVDGTRRHPATPHAIAGIVAVLLVAVVAMITSDRTTRDAQRRVAEADAKHALALAAERQRAAEADVKHAIDLAEARRQLVMLRDQVAQTSLHLADKSQELAKANVALDEFKKQQAQRRLSYDEKRALIAALRPYRGHKIAIAAIYGDDDAKAYAEDLVQAFEAAGWALDAAGITFQRWNRTPVGVEVTLNEADARAGRVSAGTGAPINAVRRMGLVDGNAVFMNPDVPACEVQLRVGHRLHVSAPAN